MATIAKLRSTLTLNTTGFRTGMQRARKAVRGFVGDIGGAVKRVAGYGLAIAGVGGAAGIGLFIKHHLAAIDAAGKFSDQIGIETEKLLALQYAGALAGVGQEGVNKSLQRMTRTVSDAVDGLSTAKDAFAALGLDALKLQAMTPDEQFLAIADAMGKVDTQSKKVQVAYNVFGREGVKMISLMQGGSDAIKANMAEAERLGLLVSRVDASKVEAANDAMTRLSFLTTAAGRTLSVQLAPFITAAATKLLEMANSGEGMGKRVIKGVGWVIRSVAKLADWLELAKAGWHFFSGAGQLAMAAVIKQFGVMFNVAADVANTKIGRLILGDGIADTTQNLAKFTNDWAAGVAQQAMDEFGKAGDALEKWQNETASRQAAAWVENIQASAQKAAEAAAAAAKSKAPSGPAEPDPQVVANAKKVSQTLVDIQKQLDQVNMTPIEIKLANLKDLGASNEQLAEARKNLEKIDALKKRAERQTDVAKTIEDLQSQVRLFGLSDQEKTLLNLEAQGATMRQLRQAQDAMAQIAELQAEQDRRDRSKRRGTADYVVAGSAEAQLLAYKGAHQMNRSDDIGTKQLSVQQRMAKLLDEIRTNQEKPVASTASTDWDL